MIEENGENSDMLVEGNILLNETFFFSQMLDDDNHLPDNSNKIGKNSQSDDSGRIRDPIPAVRGVMLAQSYQQTYRQFFPWDFFISTNLKKMGNQQQR